MNNPYPHEIFIYVPFTIHEWSINLLYTHHSPSYFPGWWFGKFLFFHIGNVIIPTDYYFSEGSVYHQPGIYNNISNSNNYHSWSLLDVNYH